LLLSSHLNKNLNSVILKLLEARRGAKVIEELSYEIIEALLDALPVDITFVDEEDRVRYFNKEGKRIFARSRKIIGIKVQKCHPQKSIHVVNQILEDFRNNKRDSANGKKRLLD